MLFLFDLLKVTIIVKQGQYDVMDMLDLFYTYFDKIPYFVNFVLTLTSAIYDLALCIYSSHR